MLFDTSFMSLHNHKMMFSFSHYSYLGSFRFQASLWYTIVRCLFLYVFISTLSIAKDVGHFACIGVIYQNYSIQLPIDVNV